MSNSSHTPWSDNPYAPQIPASLYFAEKAYFAGFLIGSIFYGFVIVLFFECLGALFSHANRARGGIKWGLVVYVVAMFCFATVYTAATLDLQSLSFIDNRNFPGDDQLPAGPIGYQFLVYSKAIGIIPEVMYLLSNWLADGLLLYRCCIIYAMNYWAITFPCLMYLSSFAMGIGFIYRSTRPNSIATDSGIVAFGAPYFTISFALNVILTLMIVIRLVRHRRNIQNAVGPSASGLYNAIVTIIVESSALYAASFVMFIIPWIIGSFIQFIFLQILSSTQIIAPFLIILRVANRRALTGNTIVSGNIGTLEFRIEEMTTVGNVVLSEGYQTGSVNASDDTPVELDEGILAEVELDHDGMSGSEGSSKV